MPPIENNVELQEQVRQALRRLQDPVYLGRCPLAHWHIARQRIPADGSPADYTVLGYAVRDLLSEAIEALKPGSSPASTASEWQLYHILDLAFRQGQSPKRIYGGQLHISRAQYYREQAKAITALTGQLCEWELHACAQADVACTEDASPSWAARLPHPTYTRLFGVEAYIIAVLEALQDPASRWLVVVDGLGGVGKTALAREATCQILELGSFADLVWETAQRQVFSWGEIQLRADLALTVDRLLDGIALQLGLTHLPRLPIAEKQRVLRAALQHNPRLIVVDNLETAQDYQSIAQELWALTRPSKVLITSRHRLDRYDPATCIHLGALDEAAAIAFIRFHAAERGIHALQEADQATVLSIHRATGGNPLAIKLVIGQVTGRPLHQVLEYLVEAKGSTEHLYRFIYQASWEMLSLPAKQVLLNMPHLSVCGGPWEAVAAASGLDGEALERAVDELVTLSLLDAGGGIEKRYSIHQLTRNFVLSELVKTVDED
jgi:hypothetical protein